MIIFFLYKLLHCIEKYKKYFIIEMGCKPCNSKDFNEFPSDELGSQDSKNRNIQKMNSIKPPFTQINISSIYIVDNKGIPDKGKLKPADKEKFQKGIPSINIPSIEAQKIVEEIKSKISNNNKNKLAPQDKVSLNSNSIISVDPDKFKEETFPIDPCGFVKKRKLNIMEDYEILNVIGRGAFGEVKKIKSKINNLIYAMKVIPKILFQESDNLQAEIDILKNLDHPNILRIFEYFEDNRYFYIITEYCAGGELLNKIINLKSFSESVAAKIIQQVLSAVRFCHSKKIVHRDLKPENLLLENDNIDSNLKVIDFGTATLFVPKQKLHELTGTAYYIAPEVIKNRYDEKCDIWSVGIILYILLSGIPPFSGTSNEEILKKVEKGNINYPPKYWSKISKEAITFISKMTTYDPNSRPSADHALQYPWILNNCIYKSPTTEDIFESLTKLKKFRAYHNFQRAVLSYMAGRMTSKAEEDKLRNIFRVFDTNGDGQISYDELIKGFINYGFKEEDAKKHVTKVMQYIDLNNNNLIDYNGSFK